MNIKYFDVAGSVWERYRKECELYCYTGILTMYAALRLADTIESKSIRDEALDMLRPFWNGKVAAVNGAYGEYVYRFGGNATAYAVHSGAISKAKKAMVNAAELLITRQMRDADGAFCRCNRQDGTPGLIWIDTVFGVCPFLLWTGLDNQRSDFIDEAVRQMKLHHERLFNREKRLYHQAYHANIPNTLTPGFWSRGMGWGMHALVDLAAELPSDHPGYGWVREVYNTAVAGCLDAQGSDGMWHQCLDDQGTYPESSGTALILYAIGKGLTAGVLDAKDAALAGFRAGIAALNTYISVDGSVFNSCRGCMAPGYNGTTGDYAVHAWLLNDPHGFGPAVLAFTEAENLYRQGQLPALSELRSEA